MIGKYGKKYAWWFGRLKVRAGRKVENELEGCARSAEYEYLVDTHNTGHKLHLSLLSNPSHGPLGPIPINTPHKH